MSDNPEIIYAQRCPHGFFHEDLCHTCYVANMEAERAQQRRIGRHERTT